MLGWGEGRWGVVKLGWGEGGAGDGNLAASPNHEVAPAVEDNPAPEGWN